MKAKFQSDPLNSTYRWEIYLTQGMPENRVALLEGYSKGIGFERTNKLELLLAKLTNPILPYLDRSDRIVIYQQVPGMKKDYHPELLTLYHHNFNLLNWARDNFVVGDFLKKFYQFRKAGQLPPPDDRRANRRALKNEYSTELSHMAYTFESPGALADFCKQQIPKFGRECMVAWYHKHSMFQPELFEARPATGVAAVATAATGGSTAPPPVEQAAVQAATSNLVNTFTRSR